MFDWPLLSLLVWIPVIAGGLLIAFGERFADLVRPFALLTTVVCLLLSVALYAGFDVTTAAMQFEEKTVWIQAFNIHYHLGVDGLSLPLILLTTLIGVLVVIGGWTISDRPHQYLAAFLMLQGLMVGMFGALDALLFYVFFEAMLVPMFLIIGIWGGPNRIYATIKFFLFTFFGSVFMLIALIWMYLQGGSFAIADLHQLPIPMEAQIWIFLAARRPRRGPDRGLRRAGGRDAEDRRLRSGSLLAADRAGCLGRARLAGDRSVAGRDHLYRLRRAGPVRHEEADRLQLNLAHGFRHPGVVPDLCHSAQYRRADRRGSWHQRRHGPDDLPWIHFRRDVSGRRCAL